GNPDPSFSLHLRSKVESVEPISVTHITGDCYEPRTVTLNVSNPFEGATPATSVDGRFTVRLIQSTLSEHP
ncbi:unnamed protein product, partial [Sphacelaria rigidula]